MFRKYDYRKSLKLVFCWMKKNSMILVRKLYQFKVEQLVFCWMKKNSMILVRKLYQFKVEHSTPLQNLLGFAKNETYLLNYDQNVCALFINMYGLVLCILD